MGNELTEYYIETLEELKHDTKYTGEKEALAEGIKAIKAVKKIEDLIRDDSHEVYAKSGVTYDVVEVQKLKGALYG